MAPSWTWGRNAWNRDIATSRSASEKSARRFHDAVAALIKGYKLASGSPQATAHVEEVVFFAAVRSSLAKLDVGQGRNDGGADFAIQQLINSAVASTEVVDILAACGFDCPDISVLSDEFMLELQNIQHRNLAVEAEEVAQR